MRIGFFSGDALCREPVTYETIHGKPLHVVPRKKRFEDEDLLMGVQSYGPAYGQRRGMRRISIPAAGQGDLSREREEGRAGSKRIRAHSGNTGVRKCGNYETVRKRHARDTRTARTLRQARVPVELQVCQLGQPSC